MWELPPYGDGGAEGTNGSLPARPIKSSARLGRRKTAAARTREVNKRTE